MAEKNEIKTLENRNRILEKQNFQLKTRLELEEKHLASLMKRHNATIEYLKQSEIKEKDRLVSMLVRGD